MVVIIVIIIIDRLEPGCSTLPLVCIKYAFIFIRKYTNTMEYWNQENVKKHKTELIMEAQR